MQTGVAKGLKVPCLFMIAEVSIRYEKNSGGWYTPYTRVSPQYTTDPDASPWTPRSHPGSNGKRLGLVGQRHGLGMESLVQITA